MTRKQGIRLCAGSRRTAHTSRVNLAVSRSYLRTGRKTTSSVRSLGHFVMMDFGSTAKRTLKYLGKTARAIFAPPSPFTCYSLTANQALKLSQQRVTATKHASSSRSQVPCARTTRSSQGTARSCATASTTRTASTRPYLPKPTRNTDSTHMPSFSTSYTYSLIAICMMC